MARRKRLLALDKLEEGNRLLDMGVPLTKVHKELGLEDLWSYQSTSDIFTADRQDLYSVTRPDWLQHSSKVEGKEVPVIQDSPANWFFEGTFPYGDWVQTVVKA